MSPDLLTPRPTGSDSSPRPPASGSAWLAALQADVETHPAVLHPFLARVAAGELDRGDFRTFGLQHHALVGFFTRYLELLLLRAPSSEQKLWLAKVLVDEYGEGSEGKDHATLYREYLSGLGVEPGAECTVSLARPVWRFVGEHLRICREEPFLVGLGALGPGHEWAIPTMFEEILAGLDLAGIGREQRLYFDLHTEQDVDHASWMAEALQKLATTAEARAEVRRGASLSLRARYEFWDGVAQAIEDARGHHNAATGTEPGDLNALRASVDAFLESRAAWPVALTPTETKLPW